MSLSHSACYCHCLGASAVDAEKWGENQTTHMEKSGDSFRAVVNTLDRADKIVLFAVFPAGKKQLMYFEVVISKISVLHQTDVYYM